MPTLIKPFRALRPAPGQAAAVAAPPYDVLNTEEARDRARGGPPVFCTFPSLKSICQKAQTPTLLRYMPGARSI